MGNESGIGDRAGGLWHGLGVAILMLAGLAVVFRILAPFYAVILLALVAAGLVYPRYQRLVKLFGGHRWTAALTICLLLFLSILVPLIITGQAVSSEALAFYELTTRQLTEKSLLEMIEGRQDLVTYLNGALTPFGITLTPQGIYNSIASSGVRMGAFFYKQGVSVATGLARLVLAFFFWLLILFYLLVDGEALKSWFHEVVPLETDQQDLVGRRFMDMAWSLVVGNGLAGVVQGVAGGLVFAALGLPGPVLWGVVMGILAFIPVVGIALVYVPVTMVLLLAGETSRAIMLFVPLAVVATLVEYFLKPILVGRRAQMHTVLVFLSLLGGLDAFGGVGLIVGPLMMTAVLTLVGIYRDRYRPGLAPEKDSASTDGVPETPTTAAETRSEA